jgi:DNA-binding LacI/PurR family transcriptional regulator
LATIKDVARLAGVSIATVSYVINDTVPVSEATRKRVWAVIRELGYRPNATARNLKAGQSRLIGYSWAPIPPDQVNPVLDEFLHILVQAASKADYHILPFPCSSDQIQVEVYEDLVYTGRVDGFIVSDTNFDDWRIAYFMDIGFPFAAFGRANKEWNFPYVDVDGAAGIRAATEHLLEQGHKCIGLIGWPEDSLTGNYRLQGYLEAMEKAGIPVDRAWIVRGEHSAQFGRRAAGQLLDLPADRRPTAIVALSDLMAIGAMAEVQARGLEVGRNVAITGFDDSPMAQYLHPPLTSLRQPIREIGQKVVEMVLRLIKGEELEERHVLLPPKLIVRKSSKPTKPCEG